MEDANRLIAVSVVIIMRTYGAELNMNSMNMNIQYRILRM